MARSGLRKKTGAGAAEPLVIGLSDPGLTPMLRAGLGGLAASVRAHAIATGQDWPGDVCVGPGRIRVEPRSVVLEWGSAEPLETLQALFAASFRLDRHGIIDLPGTYESANPPSVEVAAALQDGLKRTFLQHNKTTEKKGGPQLRSVEIDDVQAAFNFQPYASFVHQDAFSDVETARRDGSVTLAGWAYPGAVARHIDLKVTELCYGAAEALCACFAIAGCLSYQVPRTTGGALIIPEPTDLIRYARTRPRLTPRTLTDAYLPGASDGVLAVHLALRIDEIASATGGVGSVHGVQLKALPWAKQQKSRHGLVSAVAFSGAELDLYDRVRRTLPSRLRVRKDDGTVFGTSSALRGFITDNVARRQPWYRDFASATDGGSEGRRIHYYRERDNLGALFYEEREGLVVMLNHLDPAEFALVQAVHIALRSRFGAIADETRESSPATRKNRWNGERDRWRHAFAGSKTPEQIRAALADLWSRAGRNEALQEHWQDVLPLLRRAHWRTARDLALVALASYRGAGGDEPTESDPETDVDES